VNPRSATTAARRAGRYGCDHVPPTETPRSSAASPRPPPASRVPRGGPAVSSRSRLEWKAASDDVTAPAELVYDVYQGKGANPDFSRPAYTTRAGATSFTTPELSSAVPWHFGVRARDEAGNRDGNRVELESMNICR
jgi:hypothetical protein